MISGPVIRTTLHRALADSLVVHKPVDMAVAEPDPWYEIAHTELARRVGRRYSLASWDRGVFERLRAAGFSPVDAVELLLRNPPDTLKAVAQ